QRGRAFPKENPNRDAFRGKAQILEEAGALKYPPFIAFFPRDKPLPYLKNRREEFLKLGLLMSSGRYIAFAEFFAWYYNTIANQVADALIAERRITPPEKLYTYAVKAPEQ